MPIYEFHCNQCNKPFETLIRKKTDQARLVCPACGSKDLSKLISACSMITRGGESTSDFSSSASSASSCGSCGSHNCSTCH